jgi:hypothetical protein
VLNDLILLVSGIIYNDFKLVEGKILPVKIETGIDGEMFLRYRRTLNNWRRLPFFK